MLRRTAFRRKEAPPSLARVREWHGKLPTPRAPAMAVLAPSCALVVPIPKAKPIQSDAYMNAVRGLRCIRCQHPPRSQFCHRDEGKGLSIKTDCREGWPGCAVCHWVVGTSGIPREVRRAFELKAGAETRAKVLAAGLWPARLPVWEQT